MVPYLEASIHFGEPNFRTWFALISDLFCFVWFGTDARGSAFHVAEDQDGILSVALVGVDPVITCKGGMMTCHLEQS